MEEWEEWEFVRTMDDEEEREERRERMLAAISKLRAEVAKERTDRAWERAHVIRGVAECPTVQATVASNDEKRRLGIPVKGDPKIRDPGAFGKRPYTEADARADRDRWLANAKRIGG